ncbi:MAG: CHRD domain-containing protein [Pseudomonadota bacterium]|nr:CHRD domain-containing protein [Pseudomonadota bacterium]
MDAVKRFGKHSLWAIVGVATVLLAGYSGLASSDEIKVTLGGNQEIPPVTTAASGTGTFIVGEDKSVSGTVTISVMTARVAHIHEAPAGSNGPIIIPLTKTSDTVWVVPAGAKLTDAQYASYKAGNLYYNFHSDAHKSGEIRGQIKP